jgi:membrane-associated phospholipid phosphatase
MPSFSTFLVSRSKLSQALKLICLIGIVLSNQTAFSQPTLTMKKGRETAIVAGLAAHSLVNLRISSLKHHNEINYWKIRGLDKAAPQFFSPRYARTSDITFASAGLLALYSISQNKSSERNNVGLLLVQNVWMTYNITQTVKTLSFRARPYACEPGFSPQKKDDAYSFFSGHTSLTACMAASHYFYDKRLPAVNRKPAITLGLSALAIGTGVLRIKAGKHFPTDVLAGAILGTGVAYLNTRWHAQ